MIYENIVALCRQQKIALTQLERKAGLGRGTICKWAGMDSGSMSIGSVQKAAEALGVTLEELVKGR